MASPETPLLPGPAASPELPPEPAAAPAPDESQAETGTIKWFSVSKKYGFITPDGGGKDVFLHMSVLKKSAIAFLDDGARVSFDFTEAEGRLSAVSLRVLAPASDG